VSSNQQQVNDNGSNSSSSTDLSNLPSDQAQLWAMNLWVASGSEDSGQWGYQVQIWNA